MTATTVPAAVGGGKGGKLRQNCEFCSMKKVGGMSHLSMRRSKWNSVA